MNWKRTYWKNQANNILIEFSIADIPYLNKNAREYFEQKMCEVLRQNGIRCNKLPKEILLKKVIELFKTKIEDMIEQFINRSKQRKWNPEDIEKKILINTISSNSRVGMFYDFANRCYQKYQELLFEK